MNKTTERLYTNLIHATIKPRFQTILYGVLLLLTLSCVTPVQPEFDFTKGLVFVEGIATTEPGASFVNLSRSSSLTFNEFIAGATVVFRNTATGETVSLTEDSGIYLPPDGFVANVGETWALEITLPDGTRYESGPETVLPPVPITNARATYNPELFFSDVEQRFLPGHFIAVDVDDPADAENYYLWDFRSFEKLIWCQECQGTDIFRNGECIDDPNGREPGGRNFFSFSYLCEGDCWEIRYNNAVNIFSDEFANGKLTRGLPVGTVPLYSKEDIVIQLQQFSLSYTAHQFYKSLKDILENSSGLNAPPPAGLLGNIINPNNAEEFVLGRFTATSTTTASVFIVRTGIEESPVGIQILRVGESCENLCPGLPCDTPSSECGPITTATCEESRFRTAMEPEGWVAQ